MAAKIEIPAEFDVFVVEGPPEYGGWNVVYPNGARFNNRDKETALELQTAHRELMAEALSMSEGWCLFTVDGRWQLQRIDDGDPKFASDIDALLFVAKRAMEASKFHRDSLAAIGTLAQKRGA